VRPIGLRARVAVAAAAAIVAAVVLLGIAVLARLDDQLNGATDRTLRARAVDVAQLAASAPGVLDDPGALDGRLGGGSLLVQVIDRRARLYVRSGSLGARVLPEVPAVRAALRGRRPAYADAMLGTDPIRLYAAPLGELGSSQAAGGAVIVAATTAETRATLEATRRFVLLGALAAAALAAVLATLLARRALRPLSRLSSGAQAIARTGDASQRLPAPAARDEVGDLAETLNAMLASLERAREAEQRFVADASHELRTPLTALRGNVAYVARHGADPAVLADLEADAVRLGGVLDDLLALAREDAAAPVRGEPVDLVEVAREAAEADPGAGAVVEEPAEGEVLVRAERPALERAVGNLVRNARRHGPPDGRITIAAGRNGTRAWISVADEGPGLRADDAAHAFERFWRGPQARGEGSGLGLAIVRAVAERHAGRVEVDGARFTIDLPALSELSPGRGVELQAPPPEGTSP
jgi:signal transduction histidine kinase